MQVTIHLASLSMKYSKIRGVRTLSSESLTIFIHVETTLRGGAGIEFIMLVFHEIKMKLFKLFQVNLLMIVSDPR